MKKYLALVLSALILIGCLSACGSNEPAAKATDPVASAAPAAADSNADRVLNIGISSEISNIVPMSNNVAVANRDGLIVFALYDPLIWYDTTTDTLKPWIATEWSHSEDGKEWYFTLRDDVYFHNGDKMTAEDVAWSLNLIPENPVVMRRLWTIPMLPFILTPPSPPPRTSSPPTTWSCWTRATRRKWAGKATLTTPSVPARISLLTARWVLT